MKKSTTNPSIGILTTLNATSADTPFGNRTKWIRQLVRIGSKRGRCFAFTPQGVDWEKRIVHAWSYSDNTGWHRRTVPLPDVVYNRLPGRQMEKSSLVHQLKTNLAEHHIPIFNWSFFEKNDIHKRLEKSPSVLPYIPETIASPTDKQIQSLLEKYNLVYLKPIFGSLGIGIYQIQLNPQTGYQVRFRRNEKLIVKSFKQFSTLIQFIHQRRGTLKNYIAQQGIQLLQFDQSPFDFRFHLTKTNKNRWHVSGIGAKQAAKGGVTTHVHSGGSIYTPLEALLKVYEREQALEKIEQAKQVAISLAEAIEQNYPHLLGELGFDLGLDQAGRIWMFEVNSKPGRSIYKHPGLKKDGQNTLIHLFNYCSYLSKTRRSRRRVSW